MRVFCKRTFFRTNSNFFKISGKGYGESYVVWQKGNFYGIRLPQDYEKEVGIYYVIESEDPTIYTPVKKKEFDKYFMDIDQLRDQKLNIILK